MTRMRRIGVRLPLILVLMAGCEEEFRDPPVIRDLVVRDWFPEAGVFVDREEPIPVSLTFSRSLASLREVRVSLWPGPESTGEIQLSQTARNLSWGEIVPLLTTALQFLLVDGATMRTPFILYWRTREDVGAAPATGFVTSPDALRYPPQRAVVFAMDAESSFNPNDLRSFVQSTPSAMAVGYVAEGAGPDANVSLPLPALDTVFLVLAILDTSGDLTYDPTEDWYGLVRNRDGSPLTVGPGQTGFEVELRAP